MIIITMRMVGSYGSCGANLFMIYYSESLILSASKSFRHGFH